MKSKSNAKTIERNESQINFAEETEDLNNELENFGIKDNLITMPVEMLHSSPNQNDSIDLSFESDIAIENEGNINVFTETTQLISIGKQNFKLIVLN